MRCDGPLSGSNSTLEALNKTRQLLASVFWWLPQSAHMHLVGEPAQNRLAGPRGRRRWVLGLYPGLLMESFCLPSDGLGTFRRSP